MRILFKPETLEEAITALQGLHWVIRNYDPEDHDPHIVAEVGRSWDTELEIADTPLEALTGAANKWFERTGTSVE